MERQVSTATILVIVLVALAAVIGIGFAAFKITKSSGNDGVQEMATQTDYASKSKFSEFNDKEVTGRTLKNFMDSNKGNHITFVIQARSFRHPTKITSNRRIIMHNQAVYAVYGKQFDVPDSNTYLSILSGEEIPKWVSDAFLLERRDGSSLRYSGTYKSQSDFDYSAIHSNGTPEYIDDSGAFLCNLIYDNGDNIVGIIAKQKNKPGATTKETSVFAADKVLEHINKTDGGNIPLGGLVVWGESGGKKTLIREDGKAGGGFGEVGLQKDKVDTSMYDSIADNAVEEFKFEDLERKILIGYCGSSSQIKIPDTVTHVKSLTSDGENPDAYKDNLRNVSAIVFNAGCVKIENLDLSICPNIYSVYISPTTTVIGGKKLNMVQIEAPRHLKAQIQACREGTVFVNDWDKKLYNCGCPSCQIADNDWVYVWDGLDIVGYVGTLPKTIEIPLGCTGLGPRALAGGQFENIILPDSLTYIGQEAFYECQNAKSIDLSACSQIIEIPDKTFYNCDGISNVKLPTSITKIGVRAFYDCDKLTSISGLDNVVNIGDYGFYGCESLVEINSLKNVKTLGSHVFYSSGVIVNDIPPLLESAGIYCYGLTYSNVSNLSITIPGSLKSISSNMFIYTRAVNINIQEGVERIESQAFRESSYITNVYIPASVTYIASNAFAGSSNVKLHFAEGSPFLADAGAVYNEDYTILIKGPTELTASDTFTIRDTCKEIASNAFSNCTLGSLVIPDSVTKIGSTAFNKSIGLKEVYLGKNITSIGAGAFLNTSIQTIKIDEQMKLETFGTNWYRGDNSILSIITNNNPYISVVDGGVYQVNVKNPNQKILVGLIKDVKTLTCVDDCGIVAGNVGNLSALTSINLNNVHTLKNLAFYCNYKLTSVTAPNVTTVETRIFENTNASVDMPKLKNIQAGSSSGGGAFSCIVGSVKLGSDLISIPIGTFVSNNSYNKLKVIDLGDCVNVKTLLANVIGNQSKLTSLILPPNLELIEESAIKNISSTLEVELPESVKTVAAGAFVNCPNVSLKAPTHLKSQNSNDRWGIPNSRITWY